MLSWKDFPLATFSIRLEGGKGGVGVSPMGGGGEFRQSIVSARDPAKTLQYVPLH